MSMRLQAEAQAKINLALAVTGRRPDGYHTLRSVFLRLALHDSLEVDPAVEVLTDELTVDGLEVDPGPSNLVLRAAALLREQIGGPTPPLHFRLHKRIPAAAGLGGGSSDGAAAMDLAAAAWGVRLHPTARLDAALRLGADVPFFSAGHAAALVSGIGEGLHTLPAPDPPVGVLLITPRQRLVTAEVFEEFDRLDGAAGAGARVDELAGILESSVDGMTLAATAAMLQDANDLWPAALRLAPSLGAVREAVSSVLGHAALLTGSGATLFVLYPSAPAAERAADQLADLALPELEGAGIIATSTVIEGGST